MFKMLDVNNSDIKDTGIASLKYYNICVSKKNIIIKI